METIDVSGLSKDAIERLKQLFDFLKQDNVTTLKVIDELIDDIKWNIAFSKSQDFLDRMTEEALQEYEEGNT
ncbi:MAG: hypothetical protein HQL03_03680 [Nitrospirae bacterium]|nr:hypothetical protein [Nitrospirota bacterium]MBF0591787.1 hypothetical protein [Nitrospirota bacterium]